MNNKVIKTNNPQATKICKNKLNDCPMFLFVCTFVLNYISKINKD
jgi:hypothetical protein